MANVCRENEELRRQVQALLAAADEPSAFGRPPTEAKRLLARIAATDGHGTRTSDRTDRGPTLAAGTRLADRYVIESLVGEGASGRVYRAKDDVLKATVAVKVLDLEGGEELEQLRREAATLRWLRVPGVVNLQDDGVDEGRPYIVTDLVAGTPFPGAGGTRSWASIRETAVALLETLARIHAQGVIHGDLKPSNVLVDERGIPTVLDVGIASGPSIDFGDASDDDLVAGTPSYMAPERIGGAPASVATDLYAVGVMLHQALCGEVPHHATNRSGLFDRRRLEPAAPIRDLAPDVPADAAKMIDALLERDAKHRPASAYDALDLLEHLRYVRPGNPDYPWLGTRELIDKLVQAAKEGRSMDIWGPPGSGKTRTLREAAKRLEALGRAVVWLRPGSAPYDSLPADLRPSGRPKRDVAESIDVRHEAKIVGTLATGVVVIADPWDACDGESRSLLAACRAAGAILRASSDPDRLTAPARVPTAEPADLEPVFAGSRLIDHLPEDAASELCRIADGRFGAAVRQAAAWVRAGIATWEEDRVAIDRYAIERIAAGVAWGADVDQEHELPSAPGLNSLTRFDRHDESPQAGRLLELVRDATARGRTTLALALATSGSMRSTSAADSDIRGELFERALELALGEGTPSALDRVIRLASWHAPHDRRADAVRMIAVAAIHSLMTRSTDAERSLRELPDDLSDTLQACAHSVRILAARAAPVQTEEAAVAAAGVWARESNDPRAAAKLAGWVGWLRYRQGRFEDAATLHVQAARLTSPHDPVRATRLAHAAQAYLEAGSLDAAGDVAAEAVKLAARARSRQVEARAHVMLRIGQYRAGTPASPAPELVRSIRALGVPHLAGELDLTEAAAAWRGGDIEAAIAHARCGADSFRRSGSAAAELLARAILALLDPTSRVEAALLDSAGASSPPGVFAQAAGLLVAAGRAERSWLTEADARLRSLDTPLDRRLRREVLSIDEAFLFGELGKPIELLRRTSVRRRNGTGDAPSGADFPRTGVPDQGR